MIHVNVKVLDENAVIPFKKYAEDFCYDVTATSLTIEPNGVYKYGIGLAFQIDPYNDFLKKRGEIIAVALDVRPRSSISDTGLILANGPGTIDDLYRGEAFFKFYKVGQGEPYKVGDRIGQIRLVTSILMTFNEVQELDASPRGEDGFGSTGK